MKKLYTIILFILLAGPAYAQTPGVIYENPGVTVLDPNGDGYISANPTGFVGPYAPAGNETEVDEFEIPMFAFPTFGSGEALEDIRSGPDNGFTDFSVDYTTPPAATCMTYTGGNLLFRFRLADFRPNAKGYTVQVCNRRGNPVYEEENYNNTYHVWYIQLQGNVFIRLSNSQIPA